MGTEIERKFLVTNDGWRAGAKGIPFLQGYLCNEPGHSVRARLEGESATLTIKGGRTGITRAEFEYSIPHADAEQLLRQFAGGKLVEKTRYRISFAGHVWEVDEFHGENAGLIVAEIELQDADEAFAKPAWVGREVSEEDRYFNASLSRYPFSQWSEAERS